jgi:hypothetical protein
LSVNYEFDEEENRTFSGLVTQSQILGVLVLVCGGLYLVLAIYHLRFAIQGYGNVFAIVGATVAGVASSVAVAAYLLDAASKFKLVVDTEGKDIDHLLKGLVVYSGIFQGGAIILWVLSLVLVGILVASGLVAG